MNLGLVEIITLLPGKSYLSSCCRKNSVLEDRVSLWVPADPMVSGGPCNTLRRTVLCQVGDFIASHLPGFGTISLAWGRNCGDKNAAGRWR